jgi:hypothetical protein
LLDHSADLPHRAHGHSKCFRIFSGYLIGDPALRPGYKTVRGALQSFNQSRSLCTIVPLKYCDGIVLPIFVRAELLFVNHHPVNENPALHFA